MDSEGISSPRIEARMLLPLLKRMTVEEVRALIRVSAGQEKILRDFAEENPLTGRKFLATIMFRRQVLSEFNRLLARRARSLTRPVPPARPFALPVYGRSSYDSREFAGASRTE